MKSLTLRMAALITCLAGAGCAQDMSGSWQGTLHGQTDFRAIVRLDKAGDGAWAASFVSIDAADRGSRIPASLVNIDGRSIRIAFDQVAGAYDGTVNEDGTMVAGIWTQTNGPRVFNLQKATPATEWTDPSPHKVRFVTVEKDVALEVLDWGGAGRPLLLLAGLGNTAHVFDKFAPKLTANYHVYGITRRGFGDSSKPAPTDDNYNADRLADDVLAVMAALKLDHPVLAGHSVAGEELSSIGTRHPERVSGLIYLDAAQPYTFVEIKTNMQKLNAQRLAGTESARPKTPPPSLPPPAPAPALTPRDAIMKGTRDYTGIQPPFLAFVPVPHQCRPNCNTEFAKNDAAAMTGLADTLEADYPNAHVVRLPNANHYVFFSNEADVLREINAFMDGLPKS
jgi:non-heme chloroperoxidase